MRGSSLDRVCGAAGTRPRRLRRGFTLLEVMIGLALLGFALSVLIKSAAGNIFNAQQAQMTGVVTDLARGKIYDVEETLLKDGFQDTDQNTNGTFETEGWPNVAWTAKVEQVELPSWDDLQALATGHAKKMMGSGSGSALGSGALPANLGSARGSGSAGDLAGLGSSDLNNFQNSALGGMLGQLGGAGGKGGAADAASGAGALVLQQQYTMVQQVLKVSIRKVTLNTTWKVSGEDEEMKVVVFFTDAAAMDKVLMGLGAQDISDDGSGSGSGSGSGKGLNSGGKSTGTTPTKPLPSPGGPK